MGFVTLANPLDSNSVLGYASIGARPSSQAAASAAAAPAAGLYSGPLADKSFLGQPFTIYLGMILLLFLLKFLSEHDKTGLDPADVHIGVYNLFGVGVTAAVFIAGLKVLTQRYPIPGLTQFAAFL